MTVLFFAVRRCVASFYYSSGLMEEMASGFSDVSDKKRGKNK